MHTLLTDLRELWRVTLAALIFGAGLPALFAVGIRFQSLARGGVAGTSDVPPISRRRAAGAAAVLCYAAVLAVVIAGVLFIAKAFLASRLGIHLFGQA